MLDGHCTAAGTTTLKRLRWVLLLFFVALALPSALLVVQAYQQLQWESIHRYRGLAEELAARIDAKLRVLIEREENRASSEYAYFVVDGESSANFLQRSQLSELPNGQSLPGLVSYFQVAADGSLTTPLLPSVANSKQQLTVDEGERVQRLERARQVHALLSEQRLVSDNMAAPEKDSLADLASVSAAYSQSYPEQAEEESREQTARSLTATDSIEKFEQLQRQYKEQSRASAEESKTKKSASVIGRVDELNLADEYGLQESQPLAKQDTEAGQRVRRNEKIQLPQATDMDDLLLGGLASVPVDTFNTAVNPFSFAYLDADHFLLFRKIWRDGQRLVQGAVVEREPFLRELVQQPFNATGLSSVSNLIVAFDGNILQEFARPSGTRLSVRDSSIGSSLLLRTSMVVPFSDLELVFTVTQLPIGPGGRILIWTAVVLFVVLVGGFVILYRLSVKQLNLHRQQQDFISAVSHELKTPLTSIRMYGEMLRAGWVSEEKKPSYYDFIFHESERLSRLISNVLALAKMTRREMALTPKEHTLGALLDLIRSKITSQTEHAGFELQWETQDVDGQRVVVTDADALCQIMINLTDNALKFSAKAERKCIVVAATMVDERSVMISVRDFGPGIARDQMKKIFSLFYRSESELTRETVGTGIGLALVKELARAMNAEIDVHNVNPGAEFRLRLACR